MLLSALLLVLGYYLSTHFAQSVPPTPHHSSQKSCQKIQFATSSMKVTYPASLPFYGREMKVGISPPLLMLNIGVTEFLTQVLCLSFYIIYQNCCTSIRPH